MSNKAKIREDAMSLNPIDNDDHQRRVRYNWKSCGQWL